MERREKERRVFGGVQQFPLLTGSGCVMEDRRRQPDRRLNNIRVMFLGVISGATENG
jgi:hypothetical protein